MTKRHSLTFTAGPEHIDVLGHVNNAVWVRWMEVVATAHWNAMATAAQKETYAWIVSRHEIDYRGNIREGESVVATTYVPCPPRIVRFDRRVDFSNSAGKVIVSALTSWVLLDKASGRIVRVPADMAAQFLETD